MAGPTLVRPDFIKGGLVGYWKLSETSGSRVDSSGKANTLTDNNTVTSTTEDYWKTGEKSADFEQSNNEYLSRTNALQTGLDITGSYSMAMWMKVESSANGDLILGKWDGSDGYHLRFDGGGSIAARHNATTYSSGSSIPDGRWTHFGVTYDTTANLITFYINGNLLTVLAATVDPTTNTQSFELGTTNTGAQSYDGLLKDVAIWNVVLTPLQMKSLALGTDLSRHAFRPDNITTIPTHYWKLNERSLTRADSVTTNPLTLTDNNTVTSLGGYIDGAGAKTLIANSESLSHADSTDCDFSGGIWSVSFWYKTTTIAAAQSLWANGTDNANWISLALSTAGTLTLNVQDTNVDVVTVVSNAGVIKTNTFYHIACTESGDAWKIYVDGIDVTASGGTDAQRTQNYTGLFYIGADVLNANYSTATYSDFATWKGYALTSAEVASLACGLPLQQQAVISYWKLNEASGTRSDYIGLNNLTDNNTVTSDTGKVSNAADFELTNTEYLSITDASQTGMDITTDFTLLCWAKPESTGAAATLISKWNATNGYALRQLSTNVIRLEIENAGTPTVDVLADATWGHLVGRFDGATKKIFINSYESVTANVTTAPTATSLDFNLGAYNSASEHYDGLMDEALIAKRWFRDEEIKTIYCKGLSGKELTSTERSISTTSGISAIETELAIY